MGKRYPFAHFSRPRRAEHRNGGSSEWVRANDVRYVLQVIVLLSPAVTGCKGDGRDHAAVGVGAPATPFATPCPEDMSLISVERDEFCIDKYEAALDGHLYSQPLAGIDASSLRATPAHGIKPQVNISETQAQAACVASSKRLCSSAEWVTACRGAERFIFSYGNVHVVGACNDARKSPVDAVAGASLQRLDDPRLAEAPNGSEPGGSFSKCVTTSGVFDMHGNVQEWVAERGPSTGAQRFGDDVASGQGGSDETTACGPAGDEANARLVDQRDTRIAVRVDGCPDSGRGALRAHARSSSSSASPAKTARRCRCGTASRQPMKPRPSFPA